MSIRPEVNLFTALQQNKFGGVPVYIAHLALQFRQAGFDPKIIRIAKHDHFTPKEFTHGLPVQYMSLSTCEAMAQSAPSILCTPTTSGISKEKFDPAIADFCAGHNVPIVVHDVAEFYPSLLECAKDKCFRVICIRERVREQLVELGIQAEFIPHPYVARGHEPFDFARRFRAGACTRVDFRKHTDVLVKANLMLEGTSSLKRVWLHGALNRMFGHHVLSKADPQWMQMYMGEYAPNRYAGVETCERYQLVFDLTTIKGDGDGTQYSFLEAIDAGSTLVVHKEWMRKGDGELRDGINCLTVSTPGEVAALCTSPDTYEDIRAAAKHVLAAHTFDKIIPFYKEVMSL